MTRALIFDCFGVLYQGSLEHLYDITPKEAWQQLSDISRSSDYGYLSKEDYLQQVAALNGKTPEDIAAILRTDHVRNQPLFELVRALHETHKIALLSNVGRGIISQLFTGDELGELFDEVVLSSDVGMTKPHPHIYELTAAKLGTLPENCIMIDDMPTNIAGAETVGMKGIVYGSLRQTQQELTELLGGTHA